MPWIKTVEEGQATGTLKQMYDEMKEPWEGVDNILKIQSLNQLRCAVTSSSTRR